MKEIDDLINLIDYPNTLIINEINQDRLFFIEPGWIKRDLYPDEVKLILDALREYKKSVKKHLAGRK